MSATKDMYNNGIYTVWKMLRRFMDDVGLYLFIQLLTEEK